MSPCDTQAKNNLELFKVSSIQNEKRTKWKMEREPQNELTEREE